MKFGVDYIGVAVVFYCHDGSGNVFMSLRGGRSRNERGMWDIGGGKIEFGETAEDAVVREVKEEYCADIFELEFLGFRDVFVEYDGVPNHWIALDYRVLVDRESAKNGEPDAFDDVGWFSRDALPSPIHNQLPKFLAKYSERL